MFRPAEEKDFSYEIHLLKKRSIYYDLTIAEFRTFMQSVSAKTHNHFYSEHTIEVRDERGIVLDFGTYAHISLARMACNKCIATLINMQEKKKIATTDHQLLLKQPELRDNQRIMHYPHLENYHKKIGEVPGR